jgi:hypothetical protein
MFYFGMANAISWYTLINLLLVILFNSLGPVVGVMLAKLINGKK